MDADIQHGAGCSVKAEFVQVINDFSQYLFLQKQNGNALLEISKESEDRIDSWGKEPFCFQGSENAQVFILDSKADFFKGKSGRLLIKVLGAMKLSTDSVFICNAVDLKAVNKKIKTVSPMVIITLGTEAGQFLMKNKNPLEQFRGEFYEYLGIKVMPTFHPSLLLSHPEYKRQVWKDMQKVMKYTGS